MSMNVLTDMVEYIRLHPLRSQCLRDCPYHDTRIIAMLALKSGLRHRCEITEQVFANAVAECLPAISPCTYRRISRSALWLGEMALSYLKQLSDEKFAYLEEMINDQPESIRGCLRDQIYGILDATYGLHPIAAHRVLEIRHSSRLGALVIFDNGPEYSEVVFRHMLLSVCTETGAGCAVRTSLAGTGGVGVCVLRSSSERRVAIRDVKGKTIWQSMVEMQSSLPLPMGLDECDRTFIVDLACLNVLVDISSDTSGMRDFMDSVVLDLVTTRSPTEIQFLSIDATGWATNSLYYPPKVSPQYVIGSESPSVDLNGDQKQLLAWCAHAKKVLDNFHNELEVRRRLFDQCGVEWIESYKEQSRRPLAHWVLCIAHLPSDAIDISNPAYETYWGIVSAFGDLFYTEKLAEYGMHLMFFTHRRMGVDNELMFHYQMNDSNRIGVAVTYGHYDVADSYAMIGSDDAMRVCDGRCIYRSQYGAITDYCQSVAQ